MSKKERREALAAEIDAALERYAYAKNSSTRECERGVLESILWENKAGIVAYLKDDPNDHR